MTNIENMTIEEKLALSCRILANEGHEDLDLGHLSVRNPERPDTMYIKGRGFCLGEVKAENIILADFDYQVISGNHPLHAESAIHAEIYKVHPRINCVIHTHPLYATAFAATGRNQLPPVSNIAGIFATKPLPYFDFTTDMIVTPETGMALAEKLGDDTVVLLRNHGIAVAAETMEKAVVQAYFLEKACQSYYLAKGFGEINTTEKDMEDALSKANMIEKSYPRMWKTLARLYNQK